MQKKSTYAFHWAYEAKYKKNHKLSSIPQNDADSCASCMQQRYLTMGMILLDHAQKPKDGFVCELYAANILDYGNDPFRPCTKTKKEGVMCELYAAKKHDSSRDVGLCNYS